MKNAFRQHHRLSDVELNALLKNCVFAPDANCLLNIYRYADSTREDLFRVLQGLQDRIWVPYQAAKEFYKNRIEVIKDQRRKYAELDTALDDMLADLKDGKFRKSAFLCLDEIETILKPAIEQAKQRLEQQRSQHPDLLHKDMYLEKLTSIIGTALGDEPVEKKFLETCEEAQRRIDQSRPPGYRDAKKPIPDRYGDVLIWFELLKKAEEIKLPIVLVTDDDKEDWWQIIDGQKLGPRPELREEMRRHAEVDFYLANPAFFLKIASEQLNLNVAKSSVDDAAKVAEEVRSDAYFRSASSLKANSADVLTSRPAVGSDEFGQFARKAEESVARWIAPRNPTSSLDRLRTGPFDFLLTCSDGLKTGIEVMAWRHPWGGGATQRIRERFLRAFYEVSEGRLNDFRFFLVAVSAELALDLATRSERQRFEPSFDLSIGYLLPDLEYEELVSIPSHSDTPITRRFRHRQLSENSQRDVD